MASIFSIFGNVYLDSEKAEKGIKDITKQGADADKSLGSKFSSIAGKAAVMGTAIVGAATVIGGAAVNMVSKFADTAGAIDDASQRVGMSAEEYQKWTYAAKMSGIEQDKLETLMKKQQTVFADASQGVGTAAQAYKDLGIDIKGLTAGDAFNKAIDSLAGMEDETKRNAIANDLFGKSYADLAPLLNGGKDGIAALKQEASDLGGVISNEAVAQGEMLGDTIDKIKTGLSGIFNNLMGSLMPVVQQLLDMVVANMPMISDMIMQLAPIMMDVLSQLLPPLLNLIQLIMPTIVSLINLLLPIITQLFTAIMPIVTALIDYIIPPLISLIETILPMIMPIIVTLAGIISTVLTAAFTVLGATIGGLTTIFKNVFGGLIAIVKVPINWIIDAVNTMIRGLNNIKIPKWVPVVGGNNLNLPEIPRLKIGLDNVPYDDYLAYLHKGERVLTSEENKAYQGKQQGQSIVVNFYPQTMSDGELDNAFNYINRKFGMES